MKSITLNLTEEEANYLVSMLRKDASNLDMDLSGAVDISETAIRLLNEDSNVVDSLLKKLEEGQ